MRLGRLPVAEGDLLRGVPPPVPEALEAGDRDRQCDGHRVTAPDECVAALVAEAPDIGVDPDERRVAAQTPVRDDVHALTRLDQRATVYDEAVLLLALPRGRTEARRHHMRRVALAAPLLPQTLRDRHYNV